MQSSPVKKDLGRGKLSKLSLPHRSTHASGLTMRGRFISLLLILGVLFVSAVEPTVAHAQGNFVVHVSDIVDVNEAYAATGDDQEKPASMMLGESAAHHHCTVGVTTTGPDIYSVDRSRQGKFPPAAASLLVSDAQAPPTQPPSA